MIALLALLIHMPVNVDLTHGLGGRPLNGAPLVLVDDEAKWVFSFNERPSFYRYDTGSAQNVYEGERITVATLAGPKVQPRTVTQGSIRGELAKLLPLSTAETQHLAAVSKNTLLILAVSGGVAPEDKVSKLAKRVFALCLVNLDARGPDANIVYPLPPDDYGWYYGVEAQWDDRTGGIDVLVAHVLGAGAETRLEAYRLADGSLQRSPNQGRYRTLDGKRFRVWDSVQLARGVWESGPKVAANAEGGRIAFVEEDAVNVDGSRVPLASASWVRYVGKNLFAGTKRNPEMKTLAETFQWNKSSKRFELLGGFEVAGVSPNGKYWVVHFPHNGRYRLAPVRPLL